MEWHLCRLGRTGGNGKDNVVAAIRYVDTVSACSMNPAEADVWPQIQAMTWLMSTTRHSWICNGSPDMVLVEAGPGV